MKTLVYSVEELNELPEGSVVYAVLHFHDSPACAIEKLAGTWYAAGDDCPVYPELFKKFPIVVLHDPGD